MLLSILAFADGCICESCRWHESVFFSTCLEISHLDVSVFNQCRMLWLYRFRCRPLIIGVCGCMNDGHQCILWSYRLQCRPIFGWFSWRREWGPAVCAGNIHVLTSISFRRYLSKHEWKHTVHAVVIPTVMSTFLVDCGLDVNACKQCMMWSYWFWCRPVLIDSSEYLLHFLANIYFGCFRIEKIRMK